MRWVSAEQLDSWGRTRTSATELPGLVVDLILATVNDINSVRFPNGEKGQVRGFDGYLVTSHEGLNVPEGESIWEFGTELDYKGKVNGDFDKRTKQVDKSVQRLTTIVLVIPFTWDSSKAKGKIEDWIAEKKKNSSWKDIRLIDGVQLEAWLEKCPAVSAWHARNTLEITPREGVRSIDEYWQTFSNRFKPQLSEDVVLCDREKLTEELLSSLLEGPQQFNLISDSIDEVIAFVIASIRKASPEIKSFLEARTVVVDTPEAGRSLSLNKNLILILNKEVAHYPGVFSPNVPTIVPLGRQQKFGNGRVLERPSGFSMGKALTTMGFTQQEAEMLARGAGRSLSALARRIPGGASKAPAWVGESSLLLPALIAGAWDSGNALDKDIIEILSGKNKYNDYERELRPLLRCEDSPFDCEGLIWKIRAPMDAFIHLGSFIDTELLDEIKPIFSKVFGHVPKEPDPNELVSFPPTRPITHSEWLREGLATVLLLIAVWEKEAELAIPSGEGQRFANEVVNSLPGLKSDHRLLTSLRNELPLLAEAAPVPLLDALEHMLEGKGELILPIFDEVPGYLSHASHHTGVLWALETLAWDDIYFHRVSLILAKLAAIDPGGKLSNRPINSLGEIFLLWHPGTNASLDARLAVLDEIIEQLPEVAWKLLNKLLPETHSVSSGTATPKLRESASPSVTYAELWRGQSQIVSRVISMAAGSVSYIHDLIPALMRFNSEDRKRALEAVDMALEEADESNRELIWKSLSDQVRKHEYFSSSSWALSSDDLSVIKNILDKYAPEDPVVKLLELFDSPSYRLNEDNVIRSKRVSALNMLRTEYGLEEVVKLAYSAQVTYLVACSIEDARFDSQDIKVMLDESFLLEPFNEFTALLAGIYRRRVGVNLAEEWLANKLQADNADSIAFLLLSWPIEYATWAVVKRLGNEVEEAYWHGFQPRWLEGDVKFLYGLILRLLKHHRSLAALQTSLNRLEEIPSRLLFRILKSAVVELNSGVQVQEVMVQYEVGKVFESLDKRADVSEIEIAEYEYMFLSLLDHQDRPLKLHALMIRDPDFFHNVLCDVYKAENESPKENTPERRRRWKQAYSLISGLTGVPGYEKVPYSQEDLSSWVDHVLRLGKDTNRDEITKSTVGRVFAHAPNDDEDGAWPHRYIRDEIERINSDSLENGLRIERFNMRGVTTRNMYDGGVQERELAEINLEYASKLTGWPRTYKMLNDIAKSWEHYAEHEDVEARKWMLRS